MGMSRWVLNLNNRIISRQIVSVEEVRFTDLMEICSFSALLRVTKPKLVPVHTYTVVLGGVVNKKTVKRDEFEH